jgi:hypothetical protein
MRGEVQVEAWFQVTHWRAIVPRPRCVANLGAPALRSEAASPAGWSLGHSSNWLWNPTLV